MFFLGLTVIYSHLISSEHEKYGWTLWCNGIVQVSKRVYSNNIDIVDTIEGIQHNTQTILYHYRSKMKIKIWFSYSITSIHVWRKQRRNIERVIVMIKGSPPGSPEEIKFR